MLRTLICSICWGSCLTLCSAWARPNISNYNGTSIHTLARSYLNTPYQIDAATDIHGRYVTFSNPTQELPTPGLNCSGFVVDFARRALSKNLSLATVRYDRQNNSGSGAHLGEDWDFGRDLILNITEGFAREFVGPAGQLSSDGYPDRGFSLHDKTIWRQVFRQLTPNKVYFVSISKPWYGKKPYSLLHYHVGVVLKESVSQVWLYHATQLSRVHRYNLASAEGMAQFDRQFAPSRFGNKHILLLGVTH